MNAYNQRDGLWTGVQNWTAQPGCEPPRGEPRSTTHSRAVWEKFNAAAKIDMNCGDN
jgi:hypothetical protein